MPSSNRQAGSIEVSCHLSGENQVRIAFCDTGIGIPDGSLPNLFKPFERLESAYNGIEGCGIGLALCKQLIEAMGGGIGVESTQGEGSTFWIDCILSEL